jgi:hypothetical protein
MQVNPHVSITNLEFTFVFHLYEVTFFKSSHLEPRRVGRFEKNYVIYTIKLFIEL